MNLPNRLTMLRICLVPVFLLFAAPLPESVMAVGGYLGAAGFLSAFGAFISADGSWICGFIFLAAFLTDALDGHIARKYGMVTDFGKFLDPIADKLLVTAALLVLLDRGALSAWAPAIIISREFIVTGLRLVAANCGTVLAAGNLGKLKTVVQTIALTFMLFGNFSVELFSAVHIDDVFMAAAVVLTVVSGVDYILKNKTLLKFK